MLRPIVFIHRGCPDYLKITLGKARQHNPDSPLILLGDSSNAHLVREIPGLEFEQMQHDAGDSARFAKVYQHQSSLDEKFERFCMQRWILLRDLARQRGWKRLLYLDSDVLLYSDIEREGKRFDDSAMSLAPWGTSRWCGHTNFINTPEVLDEFVDFLFELYTTEEGKYQREQCPADERDWISDMSCLGFFRQRTSRPIANLTQIIDNTVFDDYVAYPGEVYERGNRLLKKKWKRLFFEDAIPYCRLKDKPDVKIRFLSLHFHATTKFMIKSFAKDRIDMFGMLNGRIAQILQKAWARMRRGAG
jgi:hypothetical protein